MNGPAISPETHGPQALLHYRSIVGPSDEASEPSVELVALETDFPVATHAAQPDIHPQLDDLPLVGPAWVRFLETHHISETYRCYRNSHSHSVLGRVSGTGRVEYTA